VILLVSSLEGLQRQLDALALFCDLRQLTVNLGKTKVMIFNGSKKTLFDHHFFFRGEEIGITNTYTYLGVLFIGPRFSLWHALQPRVSKGYGSLALLESQCFRNHFQDISSKMLLMDTLVQPTVLYGSEVWRPGFLEFGWSSAESVDHTPSLHAKSLALLLVYFLFSWFNTFVKQFAINPVRSPFYC
jgi:hypothetical protein